MRKPILTDDQVSKIAAVYDGKTETIERLVKRFRVKRHTITAAARRGGYRPGQKRVAWDQAKDTFLRNNWGRKPLQEIAKHLGATLNACRLRAKRLKISSRDFEDLTIRDLEEVTKIDHRQWHFYRDAGWLKGAWEQPRIGATPIVRVPLKALHSMLKAKPEIFDYRSADSGVRVLLDLDRLPDPPKAKRLTCRSEAWVDQEKPTAVGSLKDGATHRLELRQHSYTLKSCAALGGTSFWAPLYATDMSCPRCGCKVSRYSEGAGEYSEIEQTGDEDVMQALAGKLDLEWREDGVYDAAGKRVQDERLLETVFDGSRNSNKAFTVFRRLLGAGLNLQRATPVPDELWLPDLTGMKLREDQREALKLFRELGRIGIYIPPGRGKSAFARYVATRLEGRHIVFVHTRLVQDDWLASFRSLNVPIRVRTVLRPHLHSEVTIYEPTGRVRCVVDIYNYRTRCDFGNHEYVLRVFDEAHFLPGKHAVRLLYKVSARFQLSLTATPLREDARASMIDVISASSVGGDWTRYRDDKEIPDVPVEVHVVEDRNAKRAAAARAVKHGERTLIFSDSLAMGHWLAEDFGVPFVHSITKDKLDTVRRHPIVVLSRTGDCGISVNDVEHVLEVTFQHGGRAQSLQRHGRLLHSARAKRHTVLMTREELTRHFKRLTILEEKGCRIRLKRVTGQRGRPSVVTPLRLKQRRPALWCDLLSLAA